MIDHPFPLPLKEPSPLHHAATVARKVNAALPSAETVATVVIGSGVVMALIFAVILP